MSGILPMALRPPTLISHHRRVATSTGAVRTLVEALVADAETPSRPFEDSPTRVPGMYAFAQKMARMSAIKGRAKRADNAPTVLLQARVTPEVRAEVQAAAAASGVSIAYYLDTFLHQLVEANGALPLVAVPRPQAEELPISAA